MGSLNYVDWFGEIINNGKTIVCLTELVGDFKAVGREFEPTGTPVEVMRSILSVGRARRRAGAVRPGAGSGTSLRAAASR